MDEISSPPPCKWRKVAYGGMQPGFDDTHTDESFLEDMVTNANVVKRDLFKVFLFAPLVMYCIKRYSFRLHLWCSLGLVGLTLALVYKLQGFLFGLLLGLLVFIAFICPYWLIRIQKYKFEINGPWDEAKLCFNITE